MHRTPLGIQRSTPLCTDSSRKHGRARWEAWPYFGATTTDGISGFGVVAGRDLRCGATTWHQPTVHPMDQRHDGAIQLHPA